MNCELTTTAVADILAWLGQVDDLLFNERDMQMRLSVWLRETGHYDGVDLEYFVPWEELRHYPWKNELRLDIVVRKGEEFLPIELKYKTKGVTSVITRFNEPLSDKYQVVKDQSAQDLGMYGFWKDVRRLELVKTRFQAVAGGIAVFMTNDSSYLGLHAKPTSNNVHFSMSEGRHSRHKQWLKPDTGTAKDNPGFDVDKEYDIHWQHLDIKGINYHTAILTI